jgi:hypothetical protein
VPVDILADADDVTPGAKTATFGVVDEDDAYVGIVAPFEQRRGHVPHHLPVEAVQGLGPIEAQPPGESLLLGQYVLGSRHSVHQGIIA